MLLGEGCTQWNYGKLKYARQKVTIVVPLHLGFHARKKKKNKTCFHAIVSILSFYF